MSGRANAPHAWYNCAMRARFALLLLCLTAAGPLPDELADGGSARVVAVVDGDTVRLDDGRELRLVGIQAPKLPLDRPNFGAWPLAETAKERLEALAGGRRVHLGYDGRRLDRYGRVLAHLVTEGGVWLQGEMLRLGLARVYSFADNRALVPKLLAQERRARAAARGIWAHPYYAIVDQAKAGDATGHFALVEGRVLDAAVVRGRGYLNFGPDWRTDFTATVAPADMRLFRREDIDFASYEGRRVRVRGWLRSFNGPMIEVTHPEAIEVLEE